MDSVIWNMKWILVLFLVCKDFALSIAIDVDENDEVTILCPLSGNIQYPLWTGPDGLAYPLTDGQTIKEPGIEWINSKDLKITKALLKHDGNYTCKDANDNTGTVELDVQYFSAWADFTEATPENTRTVFTCTVHSNPRSKIVPHIVTHIREGDDDEKSDTTTTFNKCVPDPLRENRTMCNVTSVMHVSKEDNGQKMSCAFEYKNRTHITLYPTVKFYFPPTQVNITVKRIQSDQGKITLTCSTDSSNPVSVLRWRKGRLDMASENARIDSNYPRTVMNAEYNGQNMTQDIDIEVARVKDKENIFCCAVIMIKEYCDSINLDYLVASARCVVAKWITTLMIISMVFMTV